MALFYPQQPQQPPAMLQQQQRNQQANALQWPQPQPQQQQPSFPNPMSFMKAKEAGLFSSSAPQMSGDMIAADIGTAPGSAAGGSGGGMWSSAGSAGPVGAMILATLLAQKGRDETFGEGGSTGGNIFDMFMPSVMSNLEEGNWGNLAGQALGLNPITTWLFPSKGKSEGSLLF